MSRKTRWTIVFLGLTGTVIGLEVGASVAGDPDIRPWTAYIVDHVPVEVTFAAIGALALWLIVHFARRYRDR